MGCRSSSATWRAIALVPLAVLPLATGAYAAPAAHPAITPSEAAAVAAAISVRQSDLPADKQEANPVTAEERRLAAQATKCAGGVPETDALANTQSANFVSRSAPSVTVSSGTEILPNVSLVAKDLASVTGPRGLPCLQAELRDELVPSLPKNERVATHSSRLASRVSGADAAFADRFAVVVRVTHGSTTVILPTYVDLIGFTYGQAEVSLSVMTVAKLPSRSLESRLAALLVARAKAAIG